MVALVVAVDGVALGAYHAGDVAHATGQIRVGFTVVWTVATLAVVLIGLRRIRQARMSRSRGGQ